MRVLVTGADGLLGSYVTRELLKRGHDVRAFVQPGRATGTLDGLSLERVEGDILDGDAIGKAMRGCDAVIHAAASTALWPPRSPETWRVNHDAALLVAETALALGIGKLVHIGTANSFGPGTKENPGTEDDPYAAGRYGIDYQDSKRAAQEALLRMHRERGLPLSIVNPSFMFGAYDSKPGSGAMILAVYRGRVGGCPRGGRSYAYAGDVAFAVAEALERGRNGRCYLASGENLDYTEAFAAIAGAIGVPTPAARIPAPVVLAAGAVGSLSGRLGGTVPALSWAMARLANAEFYYSNARAVAELGMPRTPIQEAIREAFDWFGEHGYLDERTPDGRAR